MTTNDAYDAAMAAVKELQASGILVLLRPSKARENQELIAKYNGPERVAPGKWINVEFHPTTDDQIKAIAEKAKHLSWLGIGFDTGGCTGQRDWELDWSFRYTGIPDGELEERRDQVEGLLSEIGTVPDSGKKLVEELSRLLALLDGPTLSPEDTRNTYFQMGQRFAEIINRDDGDKLLHDLADELDKIHKKLSDGKQ